MKDQNKAEDIAAQRVQLLSPLLVNGLDPAKASQIKAALCEQTGLSERTLRRYLAQYQREGFRGLQPKGKGRPVTDAIPSHLLEQAILLRREVPNRFRKSIQQHAVPEAVYFDNGKQYRTKWMGRTCSKLGIRLLFAKPFSPESKGKVERLNGTVQRFLDEAALEKPKTLDQLNTWFQVWLSECNQNKVHSALPENITPEMAFLSDRKALRFVKADLLANAFLHSEVRKVDKVGCISFMGKKYEVGLAFIGMNVQVVYDAADITELTIEYEGYPSWKVRELVIGERAGVRPQLPGHMQPESADTSRLLRAAEHRHDQRKETQSTAVAYRHVHQEVDEHV